MDENLLYSILSNLLSNAAKFSPPDSIIHITMESQADALTFQIQDEGIGIAEADLPSLYEPFIRGEMLRKVKGLVWG